VLLGVVLALAVPGVADAALCSADEHAAAVAKADAFAKAMPAAKERYFKAHRRKAARDAFVARQFAQLGRLRDAAGCEVLDPTPSFQFGTGVPAVEQQEVRDDVVFALAQLRSLTGVTLRGPTVYVSRDVQQLADWFASRFRIGPSGAASKRAQWERLSSTAEAGEDAVFVVAFTPTWERSNAANRQKILAHELFHLVRNQLTGRPDNWGTTPSDQVRPSGPRWLNEGVAETVGYRVAAARGLLDLSSVMASLRAQAPSWTTPLQRFETITGEQSVSTAWNEEWFASNWLIETAPKGLASVLEYWSAIGGGMAWRDAFAKAFGRSVDQFYAEFAAYRATL
jgi:hypothetical protein